MSTPMPAKKLFVLGAGAWGCALTLILTPRYQNIYLYDQTAHIKTLKKNNQHPQLNSQFADNIIFTDQLSDSQFCHDVLIAVPSKVFDAVIKAMLPYLNNQHIAWLTKGFSHQEKKPLSAVFSDHINQPPCIISGPSFALEVAEKKLTALVVASNDETVRQYWVDLLQTPFLRPYQSDDVIGVEIGGLIKNSLAIAAGILSALDYGANAQAALISRGLHEMTCFGIALGAKAKTLSGLSGLGDLVLTCSDNLSRNRRFGQLLARGNNTKTALQTINATVEGLQNLPIIINIAQQKNIDMPICQQLHQVINGQQTPKEAIQYLMNRRYIDE